MRSAVVRLAAGDGAQEGDGDASEDGCVDKTGARLLRLGCGFGVAGAPAEVGPEADAEARVEQEEGEHGQRFRLAQGIEELAVAVDDDVPEEEAREQGDGCPDRGTPAKELPAIGDAEGDHVEGDAFEAPDEHDDAGRDADLPEER